ncbi:hypothetical protein Acsp05_68430 [Actinokineospora sp. NBRC 105648]|nr:hypothetical protein Acsp05_68430 [Actinokineospora sp. NBRC 105648]
MAEIRLRLCGPSNGYKAVLVPAANDELIFASETAEFYGEGTNGRTRPPSVEGTAKPG